MIAELKATQLNDLLRDMQCEVEAYAREYGLDFFPVLYEVLDYRHINAVASYDGFPVRYPHWRFGMAYERMAKSSEYGLHRIYEMVVNNNPAYAYLREGNTDTDHKTVMAHVCGHSDFFKNNYWFSKTDRKMMDHLANHASRIRRYVDRFGLETVEAFLDACLSIESLVDFHGQFIERKAKVSGGPSEIPAAVRKLQSKDPKEYMEGYMNPPEYLEAERERLIEEASRKKSFPSEPARDVLLFFMQHAPLEEWQQDILGIVRTEAMYFIPQRMTKIMNEGWAAYWHSKIMTQRALRTDELIHYADHHAGTLAVSHPSQLNPYRLGIRLFEDIEERWNKGRFGKEYDECDDTREKSTWDRKLNLGRNKIFEVRRHYNDVTFLDEFLTPEFCKSERMFVYDYNPQSGAFEISRRDFRKIKQRLLFMLTHGGEPFIELVDANYGNRGELYLRHRHEGVNLHFEKAQRTLENLFTLWTRPVQLETRLEDKGLLLRYDGKEHTDSEVD